MTNQRTYSDEEIARIFEDAARDHQDEKGEGLTLDDLKEIASASGMSAAAVERAAARLGHSMHLNPRSKSFFNEIGVGGNVELPRHLTEAEWAELIAEIRTVFDAKGKVKSSNPREEWYDSGTTIVRERSPLRDRLRITSINKKRRVFIGAAAGVAIFGLFLLLMGVDTGGEEVPLGIITALAGGLTLFFSRRNSSKLASQREAKLERIARKALHLSSQEKVDILSDMEFEPVEKVRVVRIQERSN